MNSIFNKVKDIFCDFFDEEMNISMDTTMENIDEWESVIHIQLIFEIEEAFCIQFEAEEISELTSVKKIVDTIEEKLNN